MTSPPPAASGCCLLLLLLLAAAAEGQSSRPGCLPETVCSKICVKYPQSSVTTGCRQCYPDSCRSSPPRPRQSDPPPGGCYYNGQYGPVGQVWYDNDIYPCNVYTCTASGLVHEDLSTNCRPEPVGLGTCTKSRNVGSCCYNYTCTTENVDDTLSCLDNTGTVRPHGSSWTDSTLYPCIYYVCNNSAIITFFDRSNCSAPPQQNCSMYRELGNCCYSYNCSIISQPEPCIFNGVRYESGQVFYDSDIYPCVKYICTFGTPVLLFNLTIGCTPPPDEDCEGTRDEDQCCFTYNCDCTYRGQVIPNGAQTVDDPDHPCKIVHCANGRVITVSETTCQEPNCQSDVIWPLGECCRQCGPCRDSNGVIRPVGSVWLDDPIRPCKTLTCRPNGQIAVVNVTVCDPRPHPDCTTWYMDGVCCPKWDCPNEPCVHNGVTREHGVIWPENPQKPCRYLQCNNSLVVVYKEHDPCPGPPRPDCTRRDVLYQCCPDYDCVNITCVYNGIEYREGDVWFDNPDHPCKEFTCRKEGVVKVHETVCPPLSPPDCPSRRNLTECCKECIPPGDDPCVDDEGNEHPSGETFFYDPPHNCILVICREGSIEFVYNRSDHCPARPPNCVDTGLIKDCCPVYNCTLPCFYNGTRYEHGETFWDNEDRRCIQKQCRNGVVIVIQNLLPCKPVPRGCVPNYRRPDCCHYKYTCTCMFTPDGVPISMVG